MEPIDLAAVADDFDREVALTPAIDRFCSSTAWVLAAAGALMPPRAAFSFRGENGYFAAMRGIHPAGFPYVEPIELAWGLASPLIGRDPVALVEEVVPVLANRRDWQLAILSGLSVAGPQRRALEATLPARWERRRGQPTVRHVASLEGGLDGFLARRSRDFRKSLRKAGARAVQAGLSFEPVRAAAGEAGALYERIQAVELASWKSRDQVGISQGPMRAFYGAMLPRLCERGEQRTIFARLGDRDVGYILGAVMAGEYRGLQFSYDDTLGGLDIGNLLQLQQIGELCEAGVQRYDLGTEMEYKRRWAEELMETEMLVLVR
ncbi:MAG: GNAT family N-acetyltransferase [Kofleriaceae bacterium]